MRVSFANGAGDAAAAQVNDSVTLMYGPSNSTLPLQTKLVNSTEIAKGYIEFSVSSADGLGRDGAKSMHAAFTDQAGNVTTSYTKAFTLDTYVPALKIAEQGSSLGDGKLSSTEAANGLVVRVTFDKTGSTAAKVNDWIELQLGGVLLKTDVLNSADLTKGYVDFTVAKADLGTDGSKYLGAVVHDPAGNSGSSSHLDFSYYTVL